MSTGSLSLRPWIEVQSSQDGEGRHEPNRPHPLKTKLFKSSSSLAPLVSIALKRSVEPLVTQGVPILAPSASPPQTQHQLGLRLMVSLVHTTQGNLG